MIVNVHLNFLCHARATSMRKARGVEPGELRWPIALRRWDSKQANKESKETEGERVCVRHCVWVCDPLRACDTVCECEC